MMFNSVVRSVYSKLLGIPMLYRIYHMRGVIEMFIQQKLQPCALQSFQPHPSCNIFHLKRTRNSGYVIY